MQNRRVALVGAGPGDPELITLKGLRLLQSADVVVYDALANPALLDYCRPDALLIDVGKRCGLPAPSQQAINSLLIVHARLGSAVVRLKGGDPFVFGRGGEEAQALAAAQIGWEIVPGISSAIGVPAYAGIPVTHRGIAASFAVVTGHEQRNDQTRVNWPALATAVDTLVVLMGVGRLRSIAATLIANGRDPSTPTALIQSGSGYEQRILVATLADIADQAERSQIGTPATLVIGEVVRLQSELAWFAQQAPEQLISYAA